jgi:hypothetical protein
VFISVSLLETSGFGDSFDLSGVLASAMDTKKGEFNFFFHFAL